MKKIILLSCLASILSSCDKSPNTDSVVVNITTRCWYSELNQDKILHCDCEAQKGDLVYKNTFEGLVDNWTDEGCGPKCTEKCSTKANEYFEQN